jgi:hypothetical protein
MEGRGFGEEGCCFSLRNLDGFDFLARYIACNLISICDALKDEPSIYVEARFIGIKN